MTDLVITTVAAGAVLGAGVLAALDSLPVLQDALVGAGAGALVAKLLVRRRERKEVELPARRVREIEAAWIGLLGGAGALISVAVELL